jgi:hypothetical protein
MNILEQILEKLELDPDFIVKNKTAKSKELTAKELLDKLLADGGATKAIDLFKGHDQVKIRQAFSLVFSAHPKPSPATEWYLHTLSLLDLKKCPACTTIKPLGNFAINKAMKTSKHDSWCKECTKEYRDINKDNIAETKATWQKLNPAKTSSATARRRAMKKQAVPAWTNYQAIELIYDKCPEGCHVDHWAPLAGSNVCGLHTEANLQYLKVHDNIAKGNSFSDTDPYREIWF